MGGGLALDAGGRFPRTIGCAVSGTLRLGEGNILEATPFRTVYAVPNQYTAVDDYKQRWAGDQRAEPSPLSWGSVIVIVAPTVHSSFVF